MNNVEKFADELVKLTVTELIDLKKVLKEKYGLEINEAMAVAKVEEEKPVVEEKSLFTVTLKSISAETTKKFGSIRILKEITGMDLKTVKESADNPPFIIKENISKAEAEEIKDKLIATDAVVELT